MKSNLAKDKFNAKNDLFTPTAIEFKYPSEHTINGKRFDVEMKIHHDMIE